MIEARKELIKLLKTIMWIKSFKEEVKKYTDEEQFKRSYLCAFIDEESQ